MLQVGLQAVLLCASEQEEFTKALCGELNAYGISAVYGQSMKPTWSEAQVMVPVLTDQFLFSSSCSTSVLWAAQRDMALVPHGRLIRKQLIGVSVVGASVVQCIQFQRCDRQASHRVQ